MTVYIKNIEIENIESHLVDEAGNPLLVSLLCSSDSAEETYWTDEYKEKLKEYYAEHQLTGYIILAIDSACYYGCKSEERYTMIPFDGENLIHAASFHLKVRRKDLLNVLACDMLREMPSLESTVITKPCVNLIGAGLSV